MKNQINLDLFKNMAEIKAEYYKYRYDFDNFFNGIVYHYTNINALENIIKNQSLWLTQSSYLNDYNEFEYSFNLIKEVYSENHFDHINNDSIDFIIKTLKKWSNNSYLFCFSNNSDSLTLWNNYPNFEGYSIRLDLRDIFDSLWGGNIYITSNKYTDNNILEKINIPRKSSYNYNPLDIHSGKIIYDKNIQVNIILALLRYIDKTYECYITYGEDNDFDNQILNEQVSDLYIAIHNHVLLFKGPEFKDEQESRIILSLKDINFLDVQKYRISYGAFIPYIEITFRNDNNDCKALPIRGINIGPKNNIDIAASGLQYFLNSYGYKSFIEGENIDNAGNINEVITIGKSKITLRF